MVVEGGAIEVVGGLVVVVDVVVVVVLVVVVEADVVLACSSAAIESTPSDPEQPATNANVPIHQPADPRRTVHDRPPNAGPKANRCLTSESLDLVDRDISVFDRQEREGAAVGE